MEGDTDGVMILYYLLTSKDEPSSIFITVISECFLKGHKRAKLIAEHTLYDEIHPYGWCFLDV